MVKKGGRAVRHYMIDGKVYKSKKKFIEAIKDFEPKKKIGIHCQGTVPW
jgi:hypothetical protein